MVVVVFGLLKKNKNMNKLKNKIKAIFSNGIKSFIRKHVPYFFWSNFSKIGLMDNFIDKYRYGVFIETGTFKGDTLYRLKDKFIKIYSIELSEYYYNLTKNKLKDIDNINLILGDSADKLTDLVKFIDEPIFFWLDGHYSSGLTAKAEKECPIIEEIDSIFDNNPKKFPHVILIDDARLFDGTHDYPTFSFLKNYIKSKDKRYSVSIKTDIIVCIVK